MVARGIRSIRSAHDTDRLTLGVDLEVASTLNVLDLKNLSRYRCVLSVVVESVQEGMHPDTAVEALCILAALQQRADGPGQVLDVDKTIGLNVDNALVWHRQ